MMTQIIITQTEENIDPQIQGEILLWRAVIAQALIDATIKSYAKLEYSNHRKIALAWFEDNSHDFKTICDYAGLSYLEVQNKALQYISKNKKIVY